MQYRGFIQFALLLLASGCLAFGLIATLVTLVAFAIAVELAVWSGVFEKNDSYQQQGNAL